MVPRTGRTPDADDADASDATDALAGVREFAERGLPEHIVPAVIVLDGLPLTGNGKLDRGALPGSAPAVIGRPAASTVREEMLCGVFAEILGLPYGRVDDGFFELGGHSLLAVRLISRIRTVFGAEVAVRTVFDAMTPATLAAQLDAAGRARPKPVATLRPAEVPPSYAQEGCCSPTRCRAPARSTTCRSASAYRRGSTPEALERAIADVVDRHEVLRTVLPELDGRWVQRVLPPGPVPLRRMSSPRDQVADAVREVAGHVFDLATERPLRATLISLGAEDHLLVVLVHHIASDGWSRALFAEDLAAAYRARLAGSAPDWSPLPVQYADYALWQRELLGADTDPGRRSVHNWPSGARHWPTRRWNSTTRWTGRARPWRRTGATWSPSTCRPNCTAGCCG